MLRCLLVVVVVVVSAHRHLGGRSPSRMVAKEGRRRLPSLHQRSTEEWVVERSRSRMESGLLLLHLPPHERVPDHPSPCRHLNHHHHDLPLLTFICGCADAVPTSGRGGDVAAVAGRDVMTPCHWPASDLPTTTPPHIQCCRQASCALVCPSHPVPLSLSSSHGRLTGWGSRR